MLTACFRRTTILLLLAAVLVAPWAAASPRIEGRTQPAPAVEPSLPDLLGRLWGFLQKAWSKEGCDVDPNGYCSAQPAVQPKTGCHVDPNGLCKP